jgi:hypothetical protein
MKQVIMCFLITIIIQLLVGQYNFAQNDIYKKDVIKIKKSGHSGEVKEGQIMNEQIEMDIYVKDFSIDKAKIVCSYYKKFYSEKAKKLNNRLTIEINVWNKKLTASDIIKTPDFYEPAANQKQFYKSTKWKQYLKLEDQYLHGGIIYNYANGVYKEDIY